MCKQTDVQSSISIPPVSGIRLKLFTTLLTQALKLLVPMLFKKEFNRPKWGGYFPETNLNKNFQVVRIPVSVYVNINDTQHSLEWVSHCIDALQVRTKCTVGLWLQMWQLFSTMWNTGFCSKRIHALSQNIIENKFSTAWLHLLQGFCNTPQLLKATA